jgi:transcriptional regulator with XRE-family HTH domain
MSDAIDQLDRPGVGNDIRNLRKARGINLSDMAEAIDRSIGWLSQIERQQREPAIADLRRIAGFFEIPISFFFRNDEAAPGEAGFIVRAEQRASLGTHTEGLVEDLLSPDLSGDFEMIRSVFAAGSHSEWVEARPTNEGGYVISGALTLEVGERRFDLAAGDSFQFQNETYRWINSSDEDAIAVWVISPPIY